MSSRTIQCLRCSKLARVDRSAPAKQWSLTYCNACYEEYAASKPAPKARATGKSGGASKAKRVSRPRETVERGGGLYSAADVRPMWQKEGSTDLEKIHESLRKKPGAEGGETA